jgi:hypothetical protein
MNKMVLSGMNCPCISIVRGVLLVSEFAPVFLVVDVSRLSRLFRAGIWAHGLQQVVFTILHA